jgi:hypothetical protein
MLTGDMNMDIFDVPVVHVPDLRELCVADRKVVCTGESWRTQADVSRCQSVKEVDEIERGTKDEEKEMVQIRSDEHNSRRSLKKIATSSRRKLLLRIRTPIYLQTWVRRCAGPVGEA